MHLSVGGLVVNSSEPNVMYLSVGGLVVNSSQPTSHRQVHQPLTHTDNIQPHTK